MKAINLIYEILNSMNVQLLFIWFCLIAFGSFIGYGDIIQNFGSRTQPPNFWFGGLTKLVGLLGIGLFMLIFIKDYKPYKFKQRLKNE